MEKIKLQRTTNRLKLGREWYKPYLIGNLPPSFGFKFDEEEDKDGIYQWINYKGLTYIIE